MMTSLIDIPWPKQLSGVLKSILYTQNNVDLDGYWLNVHCAVEELLFPSWPVLV